MKCNENGGCPWRQRRPQNGRLYDFCTSGLRAIECVGAVDNCYLTSASFTRIRAEILGVWQCDTCANTDNCWVYQNSRDSCACSRWQPRKDDGDE